MKIELLERDGGFMILPMLTLSWNSSACSNGLLFGWLFWARFWEF